MSKRVTPRSTAVPDQRDHLLPVRRRAIGEAHAHAAEAEGRDLEVLSESAFLHCAHSSLTAGLQHLAGRPVQDLVDVDVVGLAHGERHDPGEGVGRHGVVVVEPVDALRDVGLADCAGQFRGNGARRDHGRADVVGLSPWGLVCSKRLINVTFILYLLM